MQIRTQRQQNWPAGDVLEIATKEANLSGNGDQLIDIYSILRHFDFFLLVTTMRLTRELVGD